MSEMEGKVFKQTYNLGDSDSESSLEDEYIQATDFTKDEIEKIIAAYKSCLDPETGQQIVEYSGDSDEETDGEIEVDEKNDITASALQLIDKNEESKPRMVVYKTIYRTSSEQQSSSEDSYNENSSEEPERKEIIYETIYETLREKESSPDGLCENDLDYEPKEKRIRRYKMKRRISREQKSLPEIVCDGETNGEPKRKQIQIYKTSREKQPPPEVLVNDISEERKENLTKPKKSSIKLQPTPGAEYIEIPIPNCNQQKFKQTYREEWADEPYLKDWIQPWLADSMYAYCKFCKCKLTAHKKSLRDHSNTKKHRKNAFDATGVWGGSNSKPANVTFLMPRSRVKTEEILLNNYDSSSLSFASSSDFNMRVINDPLLPIS